jgi:predicted SAM-dependent methyltransferase
MSTDCLYDEGESDWPVKLHVGCGGISLDGYINADISGVTEEAKKKTDIRDYYAGLLGSTYRLPTPRKTVVDILADFTNLPYEANTVDKIVAIQTLEHVTPGKGRAALLHWWNILKPNGVLVISVPDVPETIKLLDSKSSKFGLRHLKGSQKDSYASHISWYSKESIVEALEEFGFVRIQVLPNIHFYPAIVVRAEKGDPYIDDRAYQFPLPEYDPSCVNVLDVGPGNYPLPFATRCFDKDDFYKDSRIVPCDVGDIYNLPYKDNEYNFAYASHVLEHLEFPEKALKELMRVGRRGYIEVPTAMVDYQQQHGRVHTRWMSLPSPIGIVMVEKTPAMGMFFDDRYVGNYAHALTHYSNSVTRNEQNIRMQFWRNQKFLNASSSWNKDTGKVAKITEIRLK